MKSIREFKVQVLVIMALSFLHLGRAWALPEYSIKEKKQCGYCHFDPQGGGPTNARGRYYGKNHTFVGFFSKPKKKKAKKVKPAPSPEASTTEAPTSVAPKTTP